MKMHRGETSLFYASLYMIFLAVQFNHVDPVSTDSLGHK